MKSKLSLTLLWLLVAFLIIISALQFGGELFRGQAGENALQVAGSITWFLILPVIAIVGALIISNQPRNTIGWLLLLPLLPLVVDKFLMVYLGNIQEAPVDPSFLLYFLVWFSQASWPLLIIPILFIVLLFPAGRPLSPRWRWMIFYGLGLLLFFWLAAIFAREYYPNESYGVDWMLVNPIGLYPTASIDGVLFPLLLSLAIFAVLCGVSLIVRFRHAGQVERLQIKWLLFASLSFIVFYVPSLLAGGFQGIVGDISNLLLGLGILGFPLAIGIAILRYQLWEIDLIIRKTVQYALVTAVLALVYFGTVVVLQTVVGQAAGERSPLVIVLSTLLIAALFNPLRRRIQEVIDRRFYRQKYDARVTLTQVAAAMQEESDLRQMVDRLTAVVEETMQPEGILVWLAEPPEGKRGP